MSYDLCKPIDYGVATVATVVTAAVEIRRDFFEYDRIVFLLGRS